MALPRERSVIPELPPVVLALGNCLADEAQVTPDTLQQALQALTFHGIALLKIPFVSYLTRGKYGIALREEAGKAFLAGSPDFISPANVLIESLRPQIGLDRSAASFDEAALD